ncbi:tape measure protein [Catenovulum sediminis]|uniref:tape measure protein n=1 Tax=Catenovulum sediminis TaxID=1740262 RepID=UPI00117E17C1|nr:tape measure protein [Catenovulum sediminis]
MVGLGAAYVGVDKLFDSLRSIFTTGDKFEKLRIQFEGLMGSVEAGEQATAWVKDFTKNTPLQLEEVSQVFVKLKSFGIDPMNGSLQAITDQAFKLGGGFQEVEGISLALGQAWAKQKLQGEEILQLIERGVPVWELLEKATGKNTIELQKLSSEGKLGRDVIQQLMDTIAQEAAGSAAKNMGTLSGLISNAKDNLAQFYNEISEAGAMDWLKAQLADVNARFKQMADDGTLKQWAKDISNTIISIGEGIKRSIGFLVEYRKEIATVVTAWAALKVGSFFKNIVSGSAAGIAALIDFVKKGVTPAHVEIDKAATKTSRLSKFLGRAGLAGSAIVAVKGLYDLGAAYFENRKAQDELTKSILDGQAIRIKYAKELQKIADDTGIYFKSLKTAIEAQEAGNLVLDEASGKWKYHAVVIDTVNHALKESQQIAIKSVDSIGTTSEAWIENAGTIEEAKAALDKHIEALEKDMPVGAQRAIDVLTKLRGEFEEQIKANNKLEDAYKTLGLESPKALQEAAQKSAAAFKTIQESGTASEEKISEAFEKMVGAAQKYADATGTTLSPTIKATAAASGLTDKLNELIKKHKEASDATDDLGKSNKDAKKPVDDLTSALQKQLDIQEQLNNERKDYNADDSRNDLTESRTLSTVGLNNEDISKMNMRELTSLRARFDKASYTSSFKHMRDYYGEQMKIVDEQMNKLEMASRKQTKPQDTNSTNINTVTSSGGSSTVDSYSTTDNTRAIRQLTESIDLLRFTLESQGDGDFLTQLEAIKSTS